MLHHTALTSLLWSHYFVPLPSGLRAFLLRGDDLDAYPSSDPMRRFWARAVTGLARVGESVPAIGIAL